MMARFLFSFFVCFFSLVWFFSATSVAFAIHNEEDHNKELPDNQQEALAKVSFRKADNSMMIRVPMGTFKM